MEEEFEDRGKLEMEEMDVEDALAPGFEPTTSEVEVASANHCATPPQTDL